MKNKYIPSHIILISTFFYSFATFHHTVKLVCDYDLGLHRFHPYFSSPVHPNSSQLMLAGSITGLGIAVVEVN